MLTIKHINEIITEVFDNDFKGLLLLPKPVISFLKNDHNSYGYGEYFIHIGNGWQIHLNFGKLPDNRRDFIREIRVLSRHEIGHFTHCPYDVKTHLRLVHCVNNEIKKFNNKKKLKDRKLKLVKDLASKICNEFADIIVDTVNFKKWQVDTVLSEKEWIYKTTNGLFQKQHNSSKIMFLTKQALWNKYDEKNKIEIVKETDKNILNIADKLSLKFDFNNISDKSTFIEKCKIYAETYLSLMDAELSEDYLESLINNQFDKNSQPELLYGDISEIQSALNEFAQELSFDEFNSLLGSLKFQNESEVKFEKYWFEARSIKIKQLPFKSGVKETANIDHPITWNPGDPVSDIDMLLTIQTSPVIIPGTTTKKWLHSNEIEEKMENQNDLSVLFVLDSSGSMLGNPIENSPYGISILASYSILNYLQEKNIKTAYINFSDSVNVISWGNEYDRIKESMLTGKGGGTTFPVSSVKNLISINKKMKAVIIFSDDEMSNINDKDTLINETVKNNIQYFYFLINKSRNKNEIIYKTKNYNVKIIHTPEDIINYLFSTSCFKT